MSTDMLTTTVPDFQQIHEAYRPRILRYLIRLVGPEEAEDLTQEVFLRAHQHLEDFRGEAQVSTWLYRIASHAAIDRMRSAAYRHGKAETGLEEDCECGSGEARVGSQIIPLEELLFEKDRFHCFMGYLDGLPLSYRLIVLLSDVEDLTTREIAEVLGLSQETVKIRLHRGRVRLFRTLKENCRPEEWL